MEIKFMDLGKDGQYSDINRDDLLADFNTILDNGNFVGGLFLDKFEEFFAGYTAAEYCVGVGSGTDALILALEALGVGPGQSVLVPGNTFIATAFAVSRVGAEPIFVDVDKYNFLIDLVDAQRKLREDTVAIIPVHLYGLSCDMYNIIKFAGRNNLMVIEDCAQAVGADFSGNHVGTLGDVGCFDGRTKVLTDNGYKTISSINVGNRVLTHKNNYKKVSKVYERYYDGNWVKLKLNGMRSTSIWGKRYINATEEHPILIRKNNKAIWVPIKEVNKGDWVYIRASKCSVCGKKIPFFWDLCEFHNPPQKKEVREKISKAKDKGKTKYPNKVKHKHYYEDILPYAKKLEKEGFRVIPIGGAVPDIIAIKDNKVYAYEIENQITCDRKLNKYKGVFENYYDDILWIEPEPKPNKNKAFADFSIFHFYFLRDNI